MRSNVELLVLELMLVRVQLHYTLRNTILCSVDTFSNAQNKNRVIH